MNDMLFWRDHSAPTNPLALRLFVIVTDDIEAADDPAGVLAKYWGLGECRRRANLSPARSSAAGVELHVMKCSKSIHVAQRSIDVRVGSRCH